MADDLALLYANKMYINRDRLNVDSCKEYIESHRYTSSYVDLINEYDDRVKFAENSPDSKENRITRIEKEILKLRNEKIALREQVLHKLITTKNIDSFFRGSTFISETGKEESFERIKDSPYFPLLKLLVCEGYIDASYADYMTFFHGKFVKSADKIFLRSVTDKKPKESSYELHNPELIVSRLPLMYFDHEETLNFSLFSFLLNDYTDGKRHTSKTIRLIKQIRECGHYYFIEGYVKTAPIINNLISVFGTEWQSFLENYIRHPNVIVPPKQ